MIEFKRYHETATFHSPLENFNKVTIDLEIREDPLTGARSIINTYLGKKWSLYPDTDYNYLDEIGEKSKERCFLCDDNIEKLTPSYPEDIIKGGRLKFKDAILFPNLFPLTKFHAVVRITSEHYKKIGEITSSMIFNGLKLSIDFLKATFQYDNRYKYPTINANHMFPAGASAPHPHFQPVNFYIPSTYHQLLLDKARQYYEKNGSCYFVDLISIEKKLKERFIWEIGESVWLSAYSPMGRNEIHVIWQNKKDLSELDEQDLKDLSLGLERLFSYFHHKKISTYNFSLFGGPFYEKPDYFRCIMKIVNRQNVVRDHRTDDYFLQKLLNSELSELTPEELAKEIKKFFK